MRKIAPALLLALLAGLFSLAFTGCGPSATQGEDTLTLLIKKNDSEKLYLRRVFDLYEAQTGVKIELDIIDDVQFEDGAAERFRKGDIPDLFLHFNNSTLDYFDVSENFYHMNDEEWVDELTDAAKAYCLDGDGNVLGLPFWECSVSGCYYNKTLLDSLGLKPAATQAEFDALCQALSSTGHTPLYWASNGCNWMFQFGLGPIFADDPDLLEKLNRNEIAYADIPAVTDMVEWLDRAHKNGWFNSDHADTAWSDIAPAMGRGKAVCVFIWDTWFSTDFLEGNGYSVEDFALMPVFMGTADSGTYEGGNMNMLMVNKNSPRSDLALDFLSFCARPENYNAAFDGVSTVNCFKGQTTNVQSPMVIDATSSIQAALRPSVVWPKIVGYKQDDVGDAVLRLFQGEVDVAGCIELMDSYRIKAAQELHADGF